MNLNQLQYFFEVAKHGGFSHASRALGIQQPAISRMVAQLQDTLGLRLFERVGNRVRLTADGERLFTECKEIFGRIERLERSARDLKETAQGPLTIGCSDLIATELAPQALTLMLEQNPGIWPTLMVAPSRTLCERLLKGDLNLAWVNTVPQIFRSQLDCRSIGSETYSLYVSHEMRKSEPTLSSFLGSREVDDVSPKSFPALNALRKLQPKAKIRISTNSQLALKAMVIQGLGVAVLPDRLMAEDLSQKRVARVQTTYRPRYASQLLLRKNHRPSKIEEAFLFSLGL